MSLTKSFSTSSFSYNQYTVHDWMKTIRTPTPYRVGNARLHLKPRIVMYAAMFITAALVLLVFFIPSGDRNRKSQPCVNAAAGNPMEKLDLTYPLSSAISTKNGMMYTIAIVTDLDTDSKSKLKPKTWISFLKYGNLTISDDHSAVEVIFSDNSVTLASSLSQGDRGMELSELIVFNGKLYTVDDRTGVVYEIWQNTVIPWVILTDGDGRHMKGFKCEWATVKDGRLYVGGLGKEWTTVDGEVVNLDPQWVKSIGPQGDVIHHDWHENYNALREKTGTNLPGYMIHESAAWSSIHQRWFFLPRRASKEKYDENKDEHRATNIMLKADDDFKNIEVSNIGKLHLTHGFSSFKFVPNTNHNVIVALKSEEDKGKIASYIMVFSVDGKIILDETYLGNKKYEGIEFV